MTLSLQDPGNLESDLQVGANAGYALLWVLLWCTVLVSKAADLGGRKAYGHAPWRLASQPAVVLFAVDVFRSAGASTTSSSSNQTVCVRCAVCWTSQSDSHPLSCVCSCRAM